MLMQLRTRCHQSRQCIRPFLAILMVLIVPLMARSAASSDRETISLDGIWQIDESKGSEDIPERFTHTVPVPGLANLAEPPFDDVDRFFSREQLANRIRAKLSPAEWLKEHWKGKVDQDRNYFWYRKTFHAPATRAIALLKINKAQFGTAVWCNGHKLGEYAGCFSASYFHLEESIRWNEENEVLVRIGAHPAVLPDDYPTGSDFEKIKWTPGIYDSVSVIVCDNPLIQSIQIAPRVEASEIVVQTTIVNRGEEPVDAQVAHCVKTWKEDQQVASTTPQTVSLEPGEQQTLTQTISIPAAHLWSPEDPFLYLLESASGGDSTSTRFGMREFRFDSTTKRAYLNGNIYYLRGSNITLHRFFEDPLCKDLPWDEQWVRRLLVDLPKQMHWNYFRFCIGPVPDRWLDICDEAGLLVQNEFFVWTGGPGWYEGYSRTHDSKEMISQYKDWMRDNWNHPSVAVWDANNETKDDLFGKTIIPAVRPLDLSNRAWENSYNAPADPNDPVEDHPYLMIGGYFGDLNFQMSDLESRDGAPDAGKLPSDTNPPIINEYGWLWLNRDGSPTRLTESVYAQLMGTEVTPRQRLDMWAYLLAGKTEFWRAHRHYAGIIHFVYLTCSYPGVYTSDHFADVTHLILDPAFADYVGESFKPLGVYINFFQPTLGADAERTFQIMMVNDYARAMQGDLELVLQDEKGQTVASSQVPFQLDALGDGSYQVELSVPLDAKGKHTLKAIARSTGAPSVDPTLSRRWVTIE